MDPIFIASGFGLGLLSSLHCVGMCGPLALSLPFAGNAGVRRWKNVFLYNTGRVSTYMFLGTIPGLVGNLFFAAGYQQLFSLIIGAAITLFFFSSIIARKRTIAFTWVQKKITRLMANPSRRQFFLIGMANGLLPCGMVYMAVSYAAIAGNVFGSTAFMLSYGLGTIPLMMALSLGWFNLAPSLRYKLRGALPYVGLAVGCLLLLRGMGLGIPYLSPVLGRHAVETVGCR